MERLRHALSGLFVAGLKIETRLKEINRYMSYPSTTGRGQACELGVGETGNQNFSYKSVSCMLK
jgi:hypothetical protein